MIISRDHGVIAIPWHSVHEIRIIKRFPAQPEFSQIGVPTRPFWFLYVNDKLFGRYSDEESALAELEDIGDALTSNSCYEINRALTEQEYQQLVREASES